MPDLIRHPVPTWIPAFAEMTILRYLIAGVISIIQMKRLVLGTAQLGMSYGIANTSGRPDLPTVKSIIQNAWENGIQEFDTAQAYGKSEQLLGKVLNDLDIVNEARIITKLDPTLDYTDKTAILKALKTSVENLGVKSIFGLMLHEENLLDLWKEGLHRILMDIVDSGHVKHLGISVDLPEKAIQALETENISMVQLPASILDKRFADAGVFQLSEDTGKQIYIRSIFLQGLLLMNNEDLPAKMRFTVSILKRFEKLVKEAGISKQTFALEYIKQSYPEAKIVFGVETLDQLKNNLNSWERKLPLDLVNRIGEEFGYVDNRILNPSLWHNCSG